MGGGDFLFPPRSPKTNTWYMNGIHIVNLGDYRRPKTGGSEPRKKRTWLKWKIFPAGVFFRYLSKVPGNSS